jgi:hypothetical protein
MMKYTTEQLYSALLRARDEQIDSLRRKGVEVADGETLNSIGKKMLTIYDTGGLAYGEWFPLFNTDTFTISGLNALPTAFGLSCEKVITDRITEAGNIFIAMFCFEPEKEQVTFYKYLDDNTFIFDKVSSDLVYTTERAEDGTYTVTISFAALNEMTIKPYLFKGGFEYNWVASSKAWFL